MYIGLAVASLLTCFVMGSLFLLKQILPLGIAIAVMYFGYGMVCFHLNKYCKWCKYVGAVIFIILSIAYWSGLQWGWVYSHLLPISFFYVSLGDRASS